VTDQQVPRWLRWGSGSLAAVLLVVGAFLESRDRLNAHPFLTNLLSGATGFLFTTFVVSVVINRLMANDRQRRWSAVSRSIAGELCRTIADATARLYLDYGFPTQEADALRRRLLPEEQDGAPISPSPDGLGALQQASARFTGLIDRTERLAEGLRRLRHDDDERVPSTVPKQIDELRGHLDAYPGGPQRDSSILLHSIVDDLLPGMLPLVDNEIPMTLATAKLRWAQRRWQARVERHRSVPYSFIRRDGTRGSGPNPLGLALRRILEHHEENPDADRVAQYRAELEDARNVLGTLAAVYDNLGIGVALNARTRPVRARIDCWSERQLDGL
jgi:hypothetical protein